jgi:tight adherence protein C
MMINTPIFLYAILGAAFVAILLVSIGIHQAVKTARQRRRMIQTIRNNRDAWAPAPAAVRPEADQPGISGKLVKLVAGVGARFSKESAAAYSGQRLRLLRAGIRGPIAGQLLWGCKILSPVLLICGFLGLGSILPQIKLLSAPATSAALVVIAIAGFYLPDLWLNLKAGIRRNKITQDLPDALDLLVVCVEAGLGLDSAFKRVADEMQMTSPQLSDEFRLLNLELRAGKARQEALRNLAARADIDSLKSLVTLMIQTEMFGTGITKALRVFSDAFRTKRFQKAEEIAAKLPVKMLIPMVFFIFPTFMAVMIGPAWISLWDNWLSK